MIGQWWSWTLAGIGVTGFWLTSRGRWRIGWSLNIAVQLTLDHLRGNHTTVGLHRLGVGLRLRLHPQPAPGGASK